MKGVQVGACYLLQITCFFMYRNKKLSVLSLTESVPCGVLDQLCLACLFSPNLLFIIILIYVKKQSCATATIVRGIFNM
jgi:hypothetical protein